MTKTYTVSEIASMIEGSFTGDALKVVEGVNSLLLANENELAFLSSAKYLAVFAKSKAGVVLVPRDYTPPERENIVMIACDNPDKSFTKLCALFAPPAIEYAPGIHPSAVIHPTAKIGENVHIGATAVIDEGAEIGANTVICAGVYIGHFCKIGFKALIYPNVSVMRYCTIGKCCIIHAGTTIGSDGFGYTPTFKGLVKVPQNGIVRIDDDVEIGANCTIDRARFAKTWIKKGVKIDNLVHVAHNVIVGESSALIGQCGVAGSAVIGRGVAVGAQAGINGHIELGDGSKVIGPSAVQKSLAPGETVIGVPAESEREFFERHMLPRKMKRLTERLAKLEALIAELTK